MKRRALVCEDDPSIRSLVRTVMTREGFAVDLAADGREALERLEEDCYDVLLVDLMMPNVDGYAVIRELRDRRPAMLKRVIVMTAASTALREEFPENICTLLPKPFDIDRLKQIVRDCLETAEETNEER
ncbi:MAG TPA: response regulator [Thermoanaerobaculia bacterium]|nr:response regulator [Thermoanaerobaculia bacterium]